MRHHTLRQVSAPAPELPAKRPLALGAGGHGGSCGVWLPPFPGGGSNLRPLRPVSSCPQSPELPVGSSPAPSLHIPPGRHGPRHLPPPLPRVFQPKAPAGSSPRRLLTRFVLLFLRLRSPRALCSAASPPPPAPCSPTLRRRPSSRWRVVSSACQVRVLPTPGDEARGHAGSGTGPSGPGGCFGEGKELVGWVRVEARLKDGARGCEQRCRVYMEAGSSWCCPWSGLGEHLHW